MIRWTVEEQVEESIKLGLARFRKEARVIFGRPVLTKRGISCCGGCASAELNIAWEADKRGDKRAIGAVFYSRQGAADYRRGGDLYFSYGAFEGQGDCSRDIMTNRIADLLAESLRKEGCEVEWSGKNSGCVVVTGPNEKIRAMKSLTAS